MGRLFYLLTAVLFFATKAWAGDGAEPKWSLQLVRAASLEVLWEAPVKQGDIFTIDYRHSSDLTPVCDTFRIESEGEIILVEEKFHWYGAGLESHPEAGSIDLSEEWTRVRLYRRMPLFLLRVGETTGHLLTVRDQRIPLLSIARGGESVWIRTMKIANN